ncbi:ZZ-type zinc finger-containing protein 3 [Galleria mellonella]|uniref:ZZ-type zinc finger-containing protein 3 n=1 Tax=Galleria mellonella TaxID=7137 RepID=A0A6J1X4A9_GALME|nr:ZZ-type zinc finger-containing protein 3 [Galleria mellonella]XP_026764163.2 ZZ-type zinc finger-containing protein 3 [Galleria mellonella]
METTEDALIPEPDDEESDSDGEFAFETDHLALRGNKDYCNLLKYIVKLEAQKIKALQDIENLAEARNKALDDPITFVHNLKSGNINFPPRQTITDIPNINWNQYGIDVSLLESEGVVDTNSNKEDLDNIKVRGRKFTDQKPETFNQLWSCEEQKRLEELLEIYPEEPIEARRYKKIARDLGTRTPIQVMCRVQKYFAKLAKAGLPIPGRAPKGVSAKNKSILYKKSTFFPQLHVPVKMEDPYDSSDTHDNTSILETKGNNKSKIELLKAAKDQRVLDEISPVYQTNIMCVGCQTTGFLGARWTDNAGTDFCTDCVVRLLPAERLIPVRQPPM